MSLMEFAILFEPHYRTTVEDEDAGDEDAYDDALEIRQIPLLTLTDGKKIKIRSRPAANCLVV